MNFLFFTQRKKQMFSSVSTDFNDRKRSLTLQCRQFKLMTDNMNLYKTCFYTSFYILRKNKHNKNIVVKNYFTVYN